MLPRITPAAPVIVHELAGHPDLVTEVKYDGFRCLVYAEGGEVTLVSRRGHAFASRTYEPVRAAVAALGADVILDGELMCLDPAGMPVFNWQWIGDGEGIHWPELDEDLSINGFLKGTDLG